MGIIVKIDQNQDLKMSKEDTEDISLSIQEEQGISAKVEMEEELIAEIDPQAEFVYRFTEIPVEFVPYTGAYKPVNLGNQSITAKYGYFQNIYNKTQIDQMFANIGIPTYQLLPVITDEQTVFTLTSVPQDISTGNLFVNGIKQVYLADYKIVSLTLTRQNSSYVLNTYDVVEYVF